MNSKVRNFPRNTGPVFALRSNRGSKRAIRLLFVVAALVFVAQLNVVVPFFYDELAIRQVGKQPLNAMAAARGKANNSTVWKRSNVIVSTHRNAPAASGSRLVNGDMSLRINQAGSLTIEQSQRDHLDPPVILWKADIFAYYFQQEWEKMFLVLNEDGLLMLVQEVRVVRDDSPVAAMKRGCEPVAPNGASCQVVVWSRETIGAAFDLDQHRLVLGDDGDLQIVDSQKQHVLWSSGTPKTSHTAMKQPPYEPLSGEDMVPQQTNIQTETAPVVDPSTVKIAWLMSFPNSGTSYTLKAVRRTGKQIAATNYGKEKATWDENKHSMPVYSHGANTGPFWVGPLQSGDYALPSTHVLVKTHCGGYCMNCTAGQSFENLDSFLVQCRSGMRHFINQNGLPAQRPAIYEKELVQKAIHLFRSPYDNIFARFHHYVANVDPSLPNSRQGFLTFCKLSDDEFGTKAELSTYVDTTALEALENIPCRSDFFRYAQWHNLAFAVTDHLALPTYILNYENYSTRHNETVSEMLDFLGYEWKGAPPIFIRGKEYSKMFLKEELDAVKIAMEALSTKKTWKHSRNYFD